jgi:hypothetical protein
MKAVPEFGPIALNLEKTALLLIRKTANLQGSYSRLSGNTSRAAVPDELSARCEIAAGHWFGERMRAKAAVAIPAGKPYLRGRKA